MSLAAILRQTNFKFESCLTNSLEESSLSLVPYSNSVIKFWQIPIFPIKLQINQINPHKIPLPGRILGYFLQLPVDRGYLFDRLFELI